MKNLDLLLLWIVSTCAALAVVGARIGLALWQLSPDPPADPVLALHWQRRRRWLVFSELSALPAFGTAGVTATIYFNLPAIASVAISMLLGGIGFALLLDGLQWLFKRRIGLPHQGSGSGS